MKYFEYHYYVYRSAITGKFVNEAFALNNLTTTIKQIVKVRLPMKRKRK